MTSNLIRNRKNAGFTLIEVMISIVLLVMISMAIYQATTQTFRYRAKIINEGDFYAGIRLALSLMDRDIAALFSPVNMNPNTGKNAVLSGGEGEEGGGIQQGFSSPGIFGSPLSAANPTTAAEQEKIDNLLRSDLGKTSDFWLPATDATAIRPSRFVGTDTRISFVTSSHMRLYKNYPESEYAKVVYELREDKESEEQIAPGTRILVKTEDTNVFDDEKTIKNEKNAKLYPLLPGVKSMKFRYYRRDKKAWENAWDTNREDMRGRYPDLIELKIEVAGVSKLSFKGTYMFKPETPFYGLDSSL